MAVKLFNLIGALTGTTGTGTLTLGVAVPGFSAFATGGVSDGDQVRYLIKDGEDQELGQGTFTASGGLLSRDVVHRSIIGGVVGTGKIGLSGTATVYLTLAAEDLSDLLALEVVSEAEAAAGVSDVARLWTARRVAQAIGALGGGGGLSPLSAPVPISNLSAVDFALTGGHKRYKLVLDHIIPGADGHQLNLRFSTDNGVSFEATQYQGQIQRGGVAQDTIAGGSVVISWGLAMNPTSAPASRLTSFVPMALRQIRRMALVGQ